jgi:hypothetical protein
MTKMTEHEALLFDRLFRATGTSAVDLARDNQVIGELLRTVRSNALRAAAHALKAHPVIYSSEHSSWLFDRADGIETGREDS